jgi:glutamate formiminotransferase
MSIPLLAVPNVSEGRDRAGIAAIGAAFAADGTTRVLDVHSDEDHHRSVFSLAGSPGTLAAALVRGAAEAVGRVDVGDGRGEHPHVGAVDVVPVVYLAAALRGAACAEALVAAEGIGLELGVSVFLYGELTGGGGHPARTRAQLRRGGVRALAERVRGGELRADFGPRAPHATAGATLVAARAPLVAFNVELAPPAGVAQARRIAGLIREGGAEGLPGVRAIGVALRREGRVVGQVSMNVERPTEVALAEVVAAVAGHARPAAAELVGLAPRVALEGFPEDLPMPGFDPARQVIENALGLLGGRAPWRGERAREPQDKARRRNDRHTHIEIEREAFGGPADEAQAPDQAPWQCGGGGRVARSDGPAPDGGGAQHGGPRAGEQAGAARTALRPTADVAGGVLQGDRGGGAADADRGCADRQKAGAGGGDLPAGAGAVPADQLLHGHVVLQAQDAQEGDAGSGLAVSTPAAPDGQAASSGPAVPGGPAASEGAASRRQGASGGSAAPGGLDVRMFTVGPVQENAYVVRAAGAGGAAGGGALLVDPGEEPQRLLDAIAALGVEIEAILITHCHFDHIGAVAPLARATGAPVYCPQIEVRLLQDIMAWTPPGFGPFESWQPERTVAGGERLSLAGVDVEVLFTPGHSPGHVTYAMVAAGAGSQVAPGAAEAAAGSMAAATPAVAPVLLSGDVLFQGSVGRTDLPGGDWNVLERSIGALVERFPGESTIYPGHMGVTTLGRELQGNPFLADVRASMASSAETSRDVPAAWPAGGQRASADPIGR